MGKLPRMRGGKLIFGSVCAFVVLSPPLAHADEPIELRQSFAGSVDFFATGAPLAIDGPDGDTMVDMLSQPASAEVAVNDVPNGAKVRKAYLYWGGSISNDDCAGDTVDDTVDFAAPGKNLAPVDADICYCSDAGAQAYDIQLCRADVTDLVDEITGDYTVDQFDALINNSATSTASFSIVLVYSANALDIRRIGLYDGLLTMASSVNQQEVVTLGGVEIDDPPTGDLTWYVLEGDIGGGGTEQVNVTGLPGGKTLDLSDAINPVDNPFNHTINTTNPVQTDSIGVDIDQFEISAALTPADNTVETTYQAGIDKYWIAYNIVGVNVFEPLFGGVSTKTWVLQDDLDGNDEPSPGDTVRYTIKLENSGSANGTVVVDDPIPEQAASWMLVDAGGGMDASGMETLSVTDLSVAPAESAEIVFDVVIDDVPDETAMSNVASFDATPEGDMGQIFAPDVIIRRDGDEDGVFDNDDNCPDDPNADQADADMDDVGDVCDDAGEDTGGADTTGTSTDGDATGGDGGTGTDTAEAGTGMDSAGSSATAGGSDEGSGSGCACNARRESLVPTGLLTLLMLARRRRARRSRRSA